uniref:Tyrosine-protein kinase catalytic domain-containing protein n=1 Tax=Strigamia maritima TaxID=126957 RepID=T1IIC7_STRMM
MWLTKTTSGMLAALAISILCAYFYPRKESRTRTPSVTEHTASEKFVETEISVDAAIYFAALKTSVNEGPQDQSIRTTREIQEETNQPKHTRSIEKYLENQSSIAINHIESSFNQLETTIFIESVKIKSEKERKEWEFGNTDDSENTPAPSQVLTETISVTTSPTVNQMNIKQICRRDILHNRSRICRSKCEGNSFSLPGMTTCLPWLTCEHINSQVKVEQELDNSGTVKKVYLAKWSNYTVAVLRLKDQQYRADFHSGLEALKLFSEERGVVQLIGFCDDSHTIITEYHPLGNILNFLRLLQHDDRFKSHNTTAVRFSLCLNYAQALLFLHDHPKGTRIMCDSSQLGKVLHQYLITNSLELILSDLDAVPLLESDSKLVCGNRILNGDLLAPEQQWTLESDEFSADKLNRYDEKTDIWKIPDVCNYILADHNDIIGYHLFDIHNKCKDQRPEKRPTANQVVDVYKQVYKFLIGD